MKIRKEITVNYEELLALGEEYVTDVQPHQIVSTKAVLILFVATN